VSRRKAESNLCVLCGVNPPSTGQGDHIPPKSLYTDAERRSARWQFHTVPACQACNGDGSVHDEALKLAISLETGEHRGSPQDVIDAMGATISNNRRLAIQMFSTRQNVEIKDESGASVPMVSVEFPRDGYEKCIGRQARGLYWRMTGAILPVTAKVKVIPYSALEDELRAHIETLFVAAPSTLLNGATFRCQMVRLENTQLLRLEYFSRHRAYAQISPLSKPASQT